MARNSDDVPFQFHTKPDLAAEILAYIGRGNIARTVRTLLEEEVKRRKAACPVLVDDHRKETAA